MTCQHFVCSASIVILFANIAMGLDLPDGQATSSDSLSLKDAVGIMRKGLNESYVKELKMNIAIVDSGANLITFSRMDGAWLGSLDISIKKAKTAVFFNMASGAIGALSQPGAPGQPDGTLYGIEHSNEGLITFPGGLPIYNKNGELIGGIGVSGSTIRNDYDIAKAGLEAYGFWRDNVNMEEDFTRFELPSPMPSSAFSNNLSFYVCQPDICCPYISQTYGRCGAAWGGRCNKDLADYAIYCNTENGWCGDTEEHQNEQDGDEYDWEPQSCVDDS